MVLVAFSSHTRILGEDSMNQSPACTFFKKWRSACAHQFHPLGQDPSTMAQLAETTVAEHFLVTAMPGQRSQSTLTWLGQECLCV